MAEEQKKGKAYRSSAELTQLSMTVWSELAPIKQCSEPVIQYLVAQVTAQVTHRTKTKGQVSAQSISQELENEGINWSNKKISRVTNALKTLIIAYLAAYTSGDPAEVKQTLSEEISKRSCIQKAQQVEAFASAIDYEAAEANSFDTVTSLLRLKGLSDFQVVLRHEISTPDCKNVNQTRAVLIFKIALPNGAIDERRVDVSLEELRQFRAELTRIEETLR